MTKRSTLTIAAALSIGGAMALSGCNGDSSAADHPSTGASTPSSTAQAPTPAQAMQAAYTATSKANSAKISEKSTTTLGGKTVHITAHGVAQFKPPKMDLHMRVQGKQLETRLLNNTAYTKLPQGKWIKMDLSKLTGQPGTAHSPTQTLQYLRAASKNVTKLGPKTIDGVHTTGYKADVDLTKAADQAKSPQAKKAIAMVEKMLGSKTLPIKVWIDGKNRLVRSSTTLDMHVSGKHIVTSTTTDLTDYGVPVKVKAPPADQVTTPPTAPAMQS